MKEKKFGLIGYPTGHSMSPVMHNKAFEVLGLPHEYRKYDVKPNNLESFVKNNKKDLTGANVTAPHKVNVIDGLDELGKNAKLIGAVNTIKFDNKVKGYNTDGLGFIKSLQMNKVDFSDKNILILGAGGASRAITFTLSKQNTNLNIYNRTLEKAQKLTEQIKNKLNKKINLVKEGELKKTISNIDVLVNTTSVGMYPDIDEMIIPTGYLHNDLIVVDIVYNPIKTKLLKEAEKLGCKIISGVDMLVQQGAESFRVWLGKEPPVEKMKKAVIERLK